MAQEFTIRQIEAPGRVLVFTRDAKPLHGFPRLAVRQRGSIRRHPGSRIGTAMLQGPEYMPHEYDFHWSPKSISGGAVKLNGAPVTDTERLIDALGTMIEDSVLVVVEWAGRAAVGFLQEATAPTARPGVYDVELEVQWVKPEERARETAAADAVRQSAGDALGDLHRGWARGLRSIQKPVIVADSALEGAIGAIRTITETLNRTAQIRASYTGVVDSVVGVRNSGVGSARTMAGEIAGAMSDVVTQGEVLRQAVSVPSPAWAPTDEGSARILTMTSRASLSKLARDTRRGATRARLLALVEARSDVIGKHTAVDGEDLRLVAWEHYGDVSRWEDLARFNDLQGSTLAGGQVILLPALGASP